MGIRCRPVARESRSGVKKELRAYDLYTGRSRESLLKAPLPIRAVAADSERIVLLIGDEDEDWFCAARRRRRRAMEKLASFRARPITAIGFVIARARSRGLRNDRLIATCSSRRGVTCDVARGLRCHADPRPPSREARRRLLHPPSITA